MLMISSNSSLTMAITTCLVFFSTVTEKPPLTSGLPPFRYPQSYFGHIEM